MARVLILLIFVLWMTWTNEPSEASQVSTARALGLFLGVYAALVLVMGMWARLLARRVTGHNLHRVLRRFNHMMTGARIAIPAWLAFGLYGLNWGHVVHQALGHAASWPVQLPALLAGTAPALLAWMGLWWSQYPADRALREQSLLIQLDENLPVHAAPGFWSYFTANLRLQLLFIVVPVLAILAMRDVAVVILGPWGGGGDGTELVISLLSTGIILIFAPEILRRVLDTQPLPDSTLRRRLEALCERHRMRYRDILLWRTQNNMGNAAVMGILPSLRYVMLSDLLMESMSDDQIEAVFAHELGHIVHRHMMWLVLCIALFMLVMAGPGTWVDQQLEAMRLPAWLPLGLVTLAISGAGFIAAFGFFHRRIERQADVFAARTLEGEADAETPRRGDAQTHWVPVSPCPRVPRVFFRRPIRRHAFLVGVVSGGDHQQHPHRGARVAAWKHRQANALPARTERQSGLNPPIRSLHAAAVCAAGAGADGLRGVDRGGGVAGESRLVGRPPLAPRRRERSACVERGYGGAVVLPVD